MRGSKPCCLGTWSTDTEPELSKFQAPNRGKWKLEWFCGIHCVIYGRLAVMAAVHRRAPHVPELTGTTAKRWDVAPCETVKFHRQIKNHSCRDFHLTGRRAGDWLAGDRPLRPVGERCGMGAPHWLKAAVRAFEIVRFFMCFHGFDGDRDPRQAHGMDWMALSVARFPKRTIPAPPSPSRHQDEDRLPPF